MVRVGEGHPAEPRFVRAERVQPVDRQVGHPVGVVPLARYRVVLRLGGRRVPARLGLEQAGKAVQVLGVVRLEPPPVVGDGMVAPGGRVHGLLGPLEAAPGTGVAPGDAGVLLPLVRRVEARLEVGLAQQRGAVARRVVQVLRHRGRVDRKGYPVGHHAVGPDVLAREHGRARRHADRVLVVGPAEVDALGGQAVDDRRPRHRASVAAETVVSLLIGRDEEDVAATGGVPRGSLRHRHTIRSLRRSSLFAPSPGLPGVPAHPSSLRLPPSHSARSMRCRSSSSSSMSSVRSPRRSRALAAESNRWAS